MYTVRNGNEFILKLSGLDIEITAKEYTTLNNIIKRTLAKYEDCKQEYIGGRITSYCVTNGGCFDCPYKKYCGKVGSRFFRTYISEYDKYLIYDHLLCTFNMNNERKNINTLWNNCMEELIRYTEGES